MSNAIDFELKKAFTELQVKMGETSKKIQFIDVQQNVMKRLLLHSDMTHAAVNALQPGTVTYECVGRMFILTELDELKRNLEHKISILSIRSDELEESKQYLEMNLQESEFNLREMVQQRRDLSERST